MKVHFKIMLLASVSLLSLNAVASVTGKEPSVSQLVFSQVTSIGKDNQAENTALCKKRYQGGFKMAIDGADDSKPRAAVSQDGRTLTFLKGEHQFFPVSQEQSTYIYTANDFIKIGTKKERIFFLSTLSPSQNHPHFFDGNFVASDGCRGAYQMYYLTINGKPYDKGVKS